MTNLSQDQVCNLAYDGYMRLKEVLKLIPVSKTAWWEGCKTGQYPKPYKIGLRATAWKKKDIHDCMSRFRSIN